MEVHQNRISDDLSLNEYINVRVHMYNLSSERLCVVQITPIIRSTVSFLFGSNFI